MSTGIASSTSPFSQDINLLPTIPHKKPAFPVRVWHHIVMLPISSQITVGLAKIFDLELLTHGTSIQNCFGILQNGGDPAKGGSEKGSTRYYAEGNDETRLAAAVKNHFYVFKDSEVRQRRAGEIVATKHSLTESPLTTFIYRDKNGNFLSETEKPQYENPSFSYLCGVCLAPRVHAALSGISSFAEEVEEDMITTAQKIIVGSAHALFSPTLRFVYTKKEIAEVFEEDFDYTGQAYKTSHKLPNDRIGLIGVCQHASLDGLKNGLRTRPLRVIAGVVQLVAGIAFTYYGIGFFI
jgi:hypothetical protein